MKKTVIITGSSRGIGLALVILFKQAGYHTIGIDKVPSADADTSMIFDLLELVNDEEVQSHFYSQIQSELKNKSLKVLINNAAIQILASIEKTSLSDFKKTMDINLNAPFLLSKLLYRHLKASKGSIINIGSIHAKQTKPKFISYATSKAALHGLTQAMAIDCGEYVRVNTIQSAAVSTAMLVDGFKDNPEGLKQLESFHPSGFIGTPDDIANLALFLAKEESRFINGSAVDIDGGIGARLYDPG